MIDFNVSVSVDVRCCGARLDGDGSIGLRCLFDGDDLGGEER